jgi:hypothetical protein
MALPRSSDARQPRTTAAVRTKGLIGDRPGGTKTDAVEVASEYLELVGAPQSSASARRELRAVTTGAFTSEALRAQAAAAAVATRIAAGGPSFVNGWLLGWRLVSASSSEARVAVWSLGTAAAKSAFIPPTWSTTVCTLRWLGNRWRVASASTSSGPQPPEQGSPDAAVMNFVGAARQFQVYPDAP